MRQEKLRDSLAGRSKSSSVWGRLPACRFAALPARRTGGSIPPGLAGGDACPTAPRAVSKDSPLAALLNVSRTLPVWLLVVWFDTLTVNSIWSPSRTKRGGFG